MVEFWWWSVQYKAPFKLYGEFEIILKPAYNQYKENMKTVRKGKASYTEKFNTHELSPWCVHSTFD